MNHGGATASCGHEAGGFVLPSVCAHLRDAGIPHPSYVKCFPGAGLNHVFICLVCADEFDQGAMPDVFGLCRECFDRATDGDLVGVRVPAIVERPGVVTVDLVHHALPSMLAPIVDLAHAERGNLWFGLCGDGSIVQFESGWGQVVVVAGDAIEAEPKHKAWMSHELAPRLSVASSGRFVAVCNDYGRRGVVIDLTTGSVTMRLDGGDGHPETVPFSLAFAVIRNREVLVHRSAWNRLDLSDPATGELLTRREPTSYSKDEPVPEHYLDYFHGRLHVSPGGHRVVDDGWVWHPIGVPETWDLSAWLHENVWESEDGPTRRSLDTRDYYWDHGMCWLDDRRVAIEGIGTDDDHMVAGARVFDATLAGPASTQRWPQALEVAQFAGPTGEFFSDGIRLFSVASDGLSVWDVDDGSRVGRETTFRPRHQNRTGGELVELLVDEVVVWSYLGRA